MESNIKIVDKLKNKSEKIRGELNGWIKFAKDEGWLNPPDGYILHLPNPKEKLKGDTLNWKIHATNFYKAIHGIDFRCKSVLDIAAGRTWTSKELALRGAKVTATDILVEDGIGLKTAYRYFKHYRIKYNLIRCDMNNLPFGDNSFDFVFVHASLHHSENIQKSISEMKRVCKKNGCLIFSNEPVGAFYSSFLNKFLIKGLSYNINETTPRLSEWLKQFKKRDITLIKASHVGWRKYFNILPVFGGNLIMRVQKR